MACPLNLENILSILYTYPCIYDMPNKGDMDRVLKLAASQ